MLMKKKKNKDKERKTEQEGEEADKLRTRSRTRRFSNHVSRLLSRSHTFAIIVILDLKIHQSTMYVDTLTLFSKNLNPKAFDPL